MKDFLKTLAPTNWFRESPLPEGAEHPDSLEPGNGLSFTGDIDPTIPEDDLFAVSEDIPSTSEPAATLPSPEPPAKLPEPMVSPAASLVPEVQPRSVPEVMPRPVETRSLPEVVINETARKQLVSADEALEIHWQAFQAAARDRKQLMDEFDQALRDSCRPISDKPTVLGAVFLAKRKACADALVDTLEDVELSLKKLLDKERRLLKGVHAAQLPGWMRDIQTHRLEIESHLMTGAAASIPSRVSLSEEE